MNDRELNAGVDAQTGFALQRNSALYLLFEHYYEKFKDEKYFICLEHHEDFLFCFLDEKDEVETIEAYQSKKKSPDKWTLNEILPIIKKVLKTGQNLLSDPIQKTKTYSHKLVFATNHTISVDYNVIKESKSKRTSIKVNEENITVAYNELPDEAKNKIKKHIDSSQLEEELNNFHFLYIDLNRTVQKQINELVGQIGVVFGKSILDKEAAIKTLFSLFQDIEYIYNQGGKKAKLLDKSKRVTSEKIDEAIKIITTKTKAYSYWRDNYKLIRNILKFRPLEDELFEFIFNSAFDLFKVNTEAEHKKILKFVENTITKSTRFQEEEIIEELFNNFKYQHNTAFDNLSLKAIIYAAYFEVTNKKETNL